jgi:hypothetical protein
VRTLVAGNPVDVINQNAYDGIDNNFNGLIDENQFLHYQQLKQSKDGTILINNLRPLGHVNSLTGEGASSMSMIDEKRDDLTDNNNDWSKDRPNGNVLLDPQGRLFDDVGLDGIGPLASNYPGADFGEGDGLPTSGFARPELNQPGEPHIDKTDVQESDQIGLTSFFYFAPANQVRLGDKESLWRNLAPGFFDVPPSIVFSRELGSSYPTQGEDGDFIYGSGYFPLLSHGTERFSLALVYGGGKGRGTPWKDEIDDLLKNKKTVQKIYDANYQFPTPPEPPTVVAVSGDHQVTLYWDRAAESFIDPVLKVKTFEGYKIYKSTDPDFSDIFVITDASGTKRGYRPIAQFDLKDGIKGYFRAPTTIFNDASGISFYLGDDIGLQHTYIDRAVDNGRRYYYAVVAYTKGDEIIGVLPAENKKNVRIGSAGEITDKDINVAVVVPNGKVAGYTRPDDGVSLVHTAGPATGTVSYKIVDETRLTGHTYRVEFLDSQVDTIDNNGNRLIDAADSTEWERVTSFYSVKDMQDVSEEFIADDTLNVTLQRKNLIASTVVVKDARGVVVPSSSYVLEPTRGVIHGSSAGSLPAGQKYTITYQYFPVFRSSNIPPVLTESRDADIFDGVQLTFTNSWGITDTLSGWAGKDAYVYNLTRVNFCPLWLGTTNHRITRFNFRITLLTLRRLDHFRITCGFPSTSGCSILQITRMCDLSLPRVLPLAVPEESPRLPIYSCWRQVLGELTTQRGKFSSSTS